MRQFLKQTFEGLLVSSIILMALYVVFITLRSCI